MLHRFPVFRAEVRLIQPRFDIIHRESGLQGDVAERSILLRARQSSLDLYFQHRLLTSRTGRRTTESGISPGLSTRHIVPIVPKLPVSK